MLDSFGLDSTVYSLDNGRNLLDGPRNGNWCGKNWSGGLNPQLNHGKDGLLGPVDSMDACCQVHDKCYGFVDNNSCSGNDEHKKKCNQELAACLNKLDRNPKNWLLPPPNGTDDSSSFFKNSAINFFK